MYIQEEFNLNMRASDKIRKLTPQFGFGEFGRIVYARTYSRLIKDDFDNILGQEEWPDTVLRVINGVMSIRKDHYVRNRIAWHEWFWQEYAEKMAQSLFRMEWLPPGRGLWAMGSDLIRERGAMALYNCAFTEIGYDWIEDLCWLKDSLMWGVGVGFRPIRNALKLEEPRGKESYTIPDSREGWVDSLRRLLDAFEGNCLPVFDYSLIRPFGAPIKTFGGTASGPEPLIAMHNQIEALCYQYIHEDKYDEIRFKTDLANLVGVCVVAGNVRRSAEIALCEMHEDDFRTLKNYKKYPYRSGWGWMSNNSVILESDDDFQCLDELALANINGHDIGYINMRNMKHGRLGKNDQVPNDMATGLNPCGEIPLEHREVCNLAETVPTRCVDVGRWIEACQFATMYCSTVTLLPTHQESTNRVVLRNRRIGVSIMDFTGWKEQIGTAGVIAALREGYDAIRHHNKLLAYEAGVLPSIRVTTVKPGGTVPKVAGKTSGASYPTFKYTLRRINVGHDSPIDKLLLAAGVPYEESVYTPRTRVYEYPIEQGPARPATQVSLWEQAFNLVLLQREWSDNAVSNTLYFKPRWSLVKKDLQPDEVFGYDIGDHEFRIQPETGLVNVYRYNPDHEEDIVEDVLSHIAPLTKSVSLLPHSDQGIFPQMPEEGITKEEYERRLEQIKSIDWSQFIGSDGEDEKYCTGDNCSVAN